MITLVYDRYEDNNYWVHDTDNDVYYTVSGTVVPNSSAAVEWIRNYGINRRATIASGTYTKLTHDTYGIVTSGTNATTADINDSVDRRYVTDAQLNGINKAVTSITQKYSNQSISSGVQQAASISLVAPQASMSYTVKAWFKAAANQNDKNIYIRINRSSSLEIFNVTKKFDDETIAITIEGICDSVTATTQGWVTSLLALDENANHSLISYAHVTSSSVASIEINTNTTDSGDLTLIGYSSYYCKL